MAYRAFPCCCWMRFIALAYIGIFLVVGIVRKDEVEYRYSTAMAFTWTVTREKLTQMKRLQSFRIRCSNKKKLNLLKDSCDAPNNLERHDAILLAPGRTNSMDIPYHITIVALRTYHSIHSNLVMPRRYIVPVNHGYPNEWIGLDLATTVYTMKWWKKNISIEETKRVSELNDLGFVWERLQPEWNIVLEALITYHTFYGHVLVPNKFIVPYGSSEWPKATWGVPLGNCVYRIRSRNDFLHGSSTSYSRRKQLDSLHFVWDVHEHTFLKFFAILRHYAKLSKTGKFTPQGIAVKPLKVPSTYTVPANDDRWPKEIWHYPLGAKCNALRQKNLYIKDKPKRQRMLEDLGFPGCGNAELSWLKVVHAAAIYARLNGHSLDVPYKFLVPEPSPDFQRQHKIHDDDAHDDDNNDVEEWPWPHYLWGLPLGQRIKDIRITGAYLKGKDKIERIRQLDALGFIWNVREHRKQQKQQGLQNVTQSSFQETSM